MQSSRLDSVRDPETSEPYPCYWVMCDDGETRHLKALERRAHCTMCLRLSQVWQIDFILVTDSDRLGVAAWSPVLRILRPIEAHLGGTE